MCLLAAAWAAHAADPKYTIAYSGFAPLNAEIFIADADGRNPKPFFPSPGQDFDASFSADGQWIVFTSDRSGSADIYRAHPDGTHLERLTDDPAFDDQAALSPDGRSLAFVSTRGGHAELWVTDPRTKKARNITNHRLGAFRPAWSPDGQWIAFSSDRDSPLPIRPGSFETIQRTEIYLIHPDGTGFRQLTHTGSFAGSPQWSADGKQIVYYQASFEDVIAISDPRRQRATTQIVAIDVASGKERALTQGKGEKWSPRWIGADRAGYFAGGPEGGLEFTDGKAGARGEFNSPSWSPDGSRVVYWRDIGQNWPPVMETHSHDPQFRLLRTGIFPSFSPTGEQLVFTNGFAALAHNSLVLANVDGSSRWTLFDDQQRSVVAPAWSPLGDKIAFSVGGAFQGFLGVNKVTSNLATLTPEGTDFTLLTDGDRNDAFPSWSPDGKRIVFRATDADGKGLRIIDVATHKITVLTAGTQTDNFPAWSPTGDEITFTSNRDGDYEIYTVHSDGSGLKRITHIPGNDAHSVWSPDGQWIAFATARDGFRDEMPLHPHNPQSYGEIAVMRPDGSDMRILTENPWEDATPGWAPMPKK